MEEGPDHVDGGLEIEDFGVEAGVSVQIRLFECGNIMHYAANYVCIAHFLPFLGSIYCHFVPKRTRHCNRLSQLTFRSIVKLTTSSPPPNISASQYAGATILKVPY